MKPMPLPPPQSSAYSMPPPSVHGNHTPANPNHMLDYLESQVRGLDMTSPLMQVCNRPGSQICLRQQRSIKIILCHVVFTNCLYVNSRCYRFSLV